MGDQTNSPINLDFLNPSLGVGSQYDVGLAGIYDMLNKSPHSKLDWTTGSSTVQDPGIFSRMMDSEIWKKMFGGENADGTSTTGAFLPILQGFIGLSGLEGAKKARHDGNKVWKQGVQEFNLNFGNQQDAYNNVVKGRAESLAAAQGAGFDKQGYMDDRMLNRMVG